MPNPLISFWRFRSYRTLPSLVVCPRVAPHVKLLQVEGARCRVLEAFFRDLDDVAGRKTSAIGCFGPARPFPVLRRHLRRRVQLLARMPLQRLAEQLLASAHTVGVRGVEKIAAELDGPIERASGLVVVGAGPPAHAPHAVAHFRDLPAYSAESAILQFLILPRPRSQELPDLIQTVSVERRDVQHGSRTTPSALGRSWPVRAVELVIFVATMATGACTASSHGSPPRPGEVGMAGVDQLEHSCDVTASRVDGSKYACVSCSNASTDSRPPRAYP